jgi:hypothetical protein
MSFIPPGQVRFILEKKEKKEANQGQTKSSFHALAKKNARASPGINSNHKG